MVILKDLKATVFIPTFNGDEFLDDLLKATLSQKLPFEYEVFIIDSGSTDRTLKIIREYPDVRLHQIPNEEFGHGRTRSLAAKMSDGDFMVYITQDAVPANDMWLHYILEPFFIDNKIAAVLGRQIPRPDCNITVKREVSSVFGNLGSNDSISLHRKLSLIDGKTRVNAPSYLSDVNAAYRRSLLIGDLPFPLVDYAEDQAIGEEVLDKGYIKAYAPQASVFHSHNFSVRQYFHRKYDETLGLIKNTDARPHVSSKELVIGTFKSTVRDWMFLARDKDYSVNMKLIQILKSPFYNLSVRLAIIMAGKSKGKRNNRLSLENKIRSRK